MVWGDRSQVKGDASLQVLYFWLSDAPLETYLWYQVIPGNDQNTSPTN